MPRLARVQWATADETREDVVALYGRAWAWAAAAIEEKQLSDRGRVRSGGNDNLASGDWAWWAQYRDKLERVAQQAGMVP